MLAWTLYKSGNYTEAREYSGQALRLGTRDSLMLFHAGMINKALSNTGEAQNFLKQALELNPNFSFLYASQARAAIS